VESVKVGVGGKDFIPGEDTVVDEDGLAIGGKGYESGGEMRPIDGDADVICGEESFVGGEGYDEVVDDSEALT